MVDKSRNSESSLSLWSLVYKEEEEEYDAIPNTWLVDRKTAFYPNRNKATVRKWARHAQDPDEDWEKIEIRFSDKLRNYESFDKAFDDAHRLNTGKQAKSESEKECRGRGQRRIKRRKFSSSSSSSDFVSDTETTSSTGDTSSDESSKRRRKKPKKTAKKSLKKKARKESRHLVMTQQSSPPTKPPQFNAQSSPPREPTPPEIHSPIASPSRTPWVVHSVPQKQTSSTASAFALKEPTTSAGPSNSISSVSETVTTSSKAVTTSLPPSASASKPTIFKAVSSKCNLKSKTHFCISSRENLTLEIIAEALCHLSRNVELLKYYLKKNKMEILEKLDELFASQKEEEDAMSEGEELEEEVKHKLPFKNKDKLEEFDDLVGHDPELQKRMVRFFRTEANYSKFSTMARSVLNLFMDRCLFEKYSWTGSNVRGVEKASLTKLNLFTALQNAVRKGYFKKYPDYKTKLKKTLKAYLLSKKKK